MIAEAHAHLHPPDPGLRDRAWLDAQWETARTVARAAPERQAILVLDEIQKVGDWSEIVKRLWDEDEATGLDLRVVLLSSALLLVQRDLSESLAGRFEIVRLGHWSFGEMRLAFGWDLERFLFFGGYPGAAPLVDDLDRWRAYLLDSLIETTLSRTSSCSTGWTSRCCASCSGRLRLFGPSWPTRNSSVTAGRRKHDHARPLPRPAGRRRDAQGLAKCWSAVASGRASSVLDTDRRRCR